MIDLDAWAEHAKRDDCFDSMIPSELRAIIGYAKALKDDNERLRDALTPTEETKAAYMCEFSVPLPERDEDGNEVIRRINVPWVIIKEIMKAIRDHADGSVERKEQGDE